MTISIILLTLSSRLLRLHHSVSCDTVSLYTITSLFLMRPRTVVSSANLTSLMDEGLERQSLVYRENGGEDRT